MGLDLDYMDGQTPLEEEEKEGLLISSIATRGELDEFEQQSIEAAIEWSIMHTSNAKTIFTEEFFCLVHRKMFSGVWRWAGKIRSTNKNLGVSYHQIGIELRALLGDAVYWMENETYSPDEIAIRVKHRVVSIRCFSNGNGRHSRLIADIIISHIFKAPVFSWGAQTISDDEQRRKKYLQALKSADYGAYNPLLEFARS